LRTFSKQFFFSFLSLYRCWPRILGIAPQGETGSSLFIYFFFAFGFLFAIFQDSRSLRPCNELVYWCACLSLSHSHWLNFINL